LRLREGRGGNRNNPKRSHEGDDFLHLTVLSWIALSHPTIRMTNNANHFYYKHKIVFCQIL
jgi:hypothetical protein